MTNDREDDTPGTFEGKFLVHVTGVEADSLMTAITRMRGMLQDHLNGERLRSGYVSLVPMSIRRMPDEE